MNYTYVVVWQVRFFEETTRSVPRNDSSARLEGVSLVGKSELMGVKG